MINTPTPPYYAVIFTSKRTEGDNGYSEMSELVSEIVKSQPGFLGIESAVSEIGISVSYWKDLESIRLWQQNADHIKAKAKGKEVWYSQYKVRIAKVEKEY